jgi:hypothetical protein
LTPDGASLKHGVWALDDDVRLGQFYLPSESTGTDDGEITYLDVHENQGCLDAPMRILKTRALLWLDAHHTANDLPVIATYLPGYSIAPVPP